MQDIYFGASWKSYLILMIEKAATLSKKGLVTRGSDSSGIMPPE
jgi:hypothetical protein